MATFYVTNGSNGIIKITDGIIDTNWSIANFPVNANPFQLVVKVSGYNTFLYVVDSENNQLYVVKITNGLATYLTSTSFAGTSDSHVEVVLHPTNKYLYLAFNGVLWCYETKVLDNSQNPRPISKTNSPYIHTATTALVIDNLGKNLYVATNNINEGNVSNYSLSNPKTPTLGHVYSVDHQTNIYKAAISPDGATLLVTVTYNSAQYINTVTIFLFKTANLTMIGNPIAIDTSGNYLSGGACFDNEGYAYVCGMAGTESVSNGMLYKLNTSNWEVNKSLEIGKAPIQICAANNFNTAYVTDFESPELYKVELRTLTLTTSYAIAGKFTHGITTLRPKTSISIAMDKQAAGITSDLNSAAWNGTMFTLVGAGGNSAAGNIGTWIAGTVPVGFPPKGSFYYVVSGRDLFYSIVQSDSSQTKLIYQSTNGRQWTALDVTSRYICSQIVSVGAGNFFLAGYSNNGGFIKELMGAKSKDLVDVMSFPTKIMHGICLGNNRCVAVGQQYCSASTTNFQFSNGANWPTFSTQNAVCWSELLSLWVSVGDDGQIFTSNDANAWTMRKSPVSTALLSVCWVEYTQIFVAVGIGATIITSLDGINWSKNTNVPSQTNLTGVATDGISAIVVGKAGTVIAVTFS